MDQVKSVQADDIYTMKKYCLIAGLWVSVLLVGCGGGGGAAEQAASPSPQAPSSTQAEVFSPVAGQSQMSHPAPAALNNPRLMFFDGVYLYVATGIDNSVVRIDANGIQTTLTGFSGSPVGVATRNGVMYVTQVGGLYQLSLNSLPVANGGSVVANPQLVANSSNNSCSNCLGLVFNGNVAYASDGTSTLHTYDTLNNGWMTISLSNQAYGLALKENYLLTTDYGQNLNGFAISPITSTWTSVVQQTVVGQPYGVAIASNGDVYVSSFVTNTVTRIRRGVVDPVPFLDSTKVCHPLGLAINEQTQSLYVASQKGAANCGLPSQTTGYILRAKIDLSF